MRRAAGIEERKGKLPPPGLTIARFIRFYGSDLFFSPQWSRRSLLDRLLRRRGQYQTGCGTIPWKLFWILYRARKHVATMEMLEASHAHAQGHATAVAGKDVTVQEQARRWTREAYPEDYEHE